MRALNGWLVMGAAVVGVVPQCASAAPMLDQIYDPGTTNVSATIGTNETGGNTIDWAQTFTVGITGQLTSVEVRLRGKSANPEPLDVDIRTTIGGLPTEPNAGANILASISVPSSQLPNSTTSFRTFDFSAANLHVTAGEVLAIVLRSEAPTVSLSYEWIGTQTSGYSGGAAFPRTTGSFMTRSYDLVFRTFVDPVPGPSSVCLLGLAGMAAARRRR